jgi:hypothetical protein
MSELWTSLKIGIRGKIDLRMFRPLGLGDP